MLYMVFYGCVYPWKLALFINECNDVEWLCSKKVQNFLVVFKLNVFPFDALPVVLSLFQLEDVVHEELLKVFIAEVDAQLLKAVYFKCLKSKYVQDSN